MTFKNLFKGMFITFVLVMVLVPIIYFNYTWGRSGGYVITSSVTRRLILGGSVWVLIALR